MDSLAIVFYLFLSFLSSGFSRGVLSVNDSRGFLPSRAAAGSLLRAGSRALRSASMRWGMYSAAGSAVPGRHRGLWLLGRLRGSSA